MYRFLRCFLCLLVVCCLILNLSPIKADAMSGGLLAPLVSGAAVTVSAPLVIAASLIALGIMAGTNDDFQRVVGNAVDSLGDWVKDGTVELIQTVDTLGKKSFYLSSELMEAIRSWAFDESVVVRKAVESMGHYFPSAEILAEAAAARYAALVYYGSGPYYYVVYSNTSPIIVRPFNEKTGAGIVIETQEPNASIYVCTWVSGSFSKESGMVVQGATDPIVSVQRLGAVDPVEFASNYSLTLGQVASVPVDGTSAREWSEEYTSRGLYVVVGSGGSSTPPEGDSGDEGDDNNGKWYWPLVLGAAAFGAGAGIGALTQQDQWTGDTPEDFNDYTTGTEYEIVGSPEVEFGTGIELAPVVDPAPDSGGDSGDNPGAGSDPDEDPDAGAGGSNDYSSWLSKILALLEKIWNSILEIPTKFATWFDNIISEIQELPSKFATWFENIISAIQELPSKFADWFGNLASKLENIWEAICNIPEAIGNVLRSIFVPSEDFLTEKVQDLRNRFNWIEPILGYGNYIKAQLVNPEPPVLYVHLGNAEGSYNYGGTVKFLDLTWYERYKSQGDAIISGFLWALFAWRMYVKLPGIINGVAGDVGHISYGESAWQKAEGRKDRKEKGGKNK